MPESLKRRVVPRRWITSGTSAVTSLMIVSPLVANGMTLHAPGMHDALGHAPFHNVQLAASKGGEGGEGGEGSIAGMPHDVGILTTAWLMAGHLKVGVALYAEGHKDMAATHMKHPGDELYVEIAPELDEHGIEGLADGLVGLSVAVEQDAGTDAIGQAHAVVESILQEITETFSASEKNVLAAVVQLMRNAADEYALGVKDGKITNMHEYQDAWGFLTIASQQAQKLAQTGESKTASEAVAKVVQQVRVAQSVFGGIVPNGSVDGEASVLFGAVARAELAASQVK